MTYNGVSFNDKWVLSMSEEQFATHLSNQHLFKPETRQVQLREAYQIIKQLHDANNIKHA